MFQRYIDGYNNDDTDSTFIFPYNDEKIGKIKKCFIVRQRNATFVNFNLPESKIRLDTS